MAYQERSSGRTLSEALNGKNNAFGAIRLVLAAAVIVSHAWPLGGYGSEPTHFLFQNQAHIGTIAVFGFMAISGYVVTKSAAATDLLQFMWRRFLRMYPAFWAALGVTAVILGPAVYISANGGLAGYFSLSEGGPVTYLVRNLDLTIAQWGIEGVFSDLPYDSVNGSLWTLAYEWGCYILIGALAFLGVLRKARWAVPVLTAAFLLLQIGHIFTPQLVATLPFVGNEDRVSLTLMFLWGASWAVYSRTLRLTNLLGIASLVVLAGSLFLGGFLILGLPALAYGIIWIAVALPRRLHFIGDKNDYSYGIYLYGWPAQQFGMFAGWGALGLIPWTILSLLVASGCAWLSWHLLEKRVMQLKVFGPGRGFVFWRNKLRSRTPGNRKKAYIFK